MILYALLAVPVLAIATWRLRADCLGGKLQAWIAAVSWLLLPIYFLWTVGMVLGDPAPGPDGQRHKEPGALWVVDLCLFASALAIWLGVEFVVRLMSKRAPKSLGRSARIAARSLLAARLLMLASPFVPPLFGLGGLRMDWAIDPAFLILLVLPAAAPVALGAAALWSWRRAAAEA